MPALEDVYLSAYWSLKKASVSTEGHRYQCEGKPAVPARGLNESS